ncbi:hypothetical protein [Haloarchaeobius sp. HME9146]|uniref:hypothetical protein n=1 Tax=Haloarchaeobius sp. HME9146 TaxID=2978732 RepID=UPI0021C15F14|nr:hypothetical protein [Haloarchaeobius sp. HME9146]MCT9095621.1 hypothetical protein [Haloarchaeobius sp. HME9146]
MIPASITDRFSAIPPVYAVTLPIIVAPWGYLSGWLFGTHLVGSDITAVWLTTVLLTVAVLLVVSLRS